MKQLYLLLVGLLLASPAAHAQWVLQPFTFNNTIAPYPPNAAAIHIVDAQTVWATSINQYMGYNFGDNEVAHTADGGATWVVREVADMDFYNESIFGIVGLSASTALICTGNLVGPGRILKTTDSGRTWTTQTTPAQFGSSDSFANFLLAFSATELLCVGDPTASNNNYFEMYRSVDAGTSWTAVATSTMPAALSDEIAIFSYKAQVGNHVWFTTTAGRVFHSADRGATWSVAASGLATAGSVAFRDALNGLIYNASSRSLVRTTDGGATWAPVAYTGSAHRVLAAVPGTGQYLAVGQGPDAGTALSRDNGTTWTALETTRSHFDLAVLNANVAWSAAVDYRSNRREGLGAYKLSATVLAACSAATLPAGTLGLYPNPSPGGLLTLTLPAGLPLGEAELSFCDALGRCVLKQAVVAASSTLNLGRLAPGLYTVQLRTSLGLAQQQQLMVQ
jgi:photosystem II stability/assembly factor-like uncharacterized protein